MSLEALARDKSAACLSNWQVSLHALRLETAAAAHIEACEPCSARVRHEQAMVQAAEQEKVPSALLARASATSGFAPWRLRRRLWLLVGAGLALLLAGQVVRRWHRQAHANPRLSAAARPASELLR